MQKTLAFLEQNVQWLALALAAIFFGLCVWWYVLTPPAQVVNAKLSKEPLTPQNVDELIKNGPVQEITRSRDSNPEVAISVPDVVRPWQSKMNSAGASLLAATWPRPEYDPHQIIGGGEGPNIARGDVVKDLPVLPKATPQTAVAGLSVVSAPVLTQGGAKQVAQTNSDQLWVTFSAVLPAENIKAAFMTIENALNQKLQAQGLPVYQFKTDILKIELQRQRGSMGPNGPMFPNSDVGVETIPAPKYLDQKPLPDPKAQLVEKVNFGDWAEKNIDLVYQPKFFDVHGGSQWTAPTIGGASPAGAAAAPAPGTPKGLAGIPPALPPRGVAPAQPNPNFGGLGNAAAGMNKNLGEIVPANLSQDILVWAHDDTVQPGAVYRYRIVYYMKNPVLGLENIADKSIIDTLEVKSPPSDWSTPVTVPQVTKFWFARAGTNALADIYHWENGGWTRKQNVPINPGDRVADSEWTVVDVHNGSREREKYVILTNDNGEIVRRFPNSDRNNDEKKALDTQITSGAAAGAAGGNTTPQPSSPPRTPAAAPGMRAGVIPRGGG